MFIVMAILLAILSAPTAAFAFSGAGSGTSGDPYVITNVNQLQEMQDDLTAHYVLDNDIDASITATWNDAATSTDTLEGFKPVGPDSTHRFYGTLDGQGHTITGLTINRSGTMVVGIFGFASGSDDDALRNVTFESVSIAGGSATAGALAGVANSDVTNCHVSSGTISGGFIVGGLVGSASDLTDCTSAATVSGGNYVGGIAGDGGRLTRCHATGDVTGTGNRIGGLVGRIDGGSITECWATGDVSGDTWVGGLVGQIEGDNIRRCFATGDVSGDTLVGGFVGEAGYGGINNIRDSYALGSVTGNTTVGGFAGHHYDGDLIHCYSAGFTTGSTAGGFMAFDNGNGVVEACFWDIDASGQSGSACGEGKTTAEMMTQTTFDPPWDFLDIWGMIEGTSYPFLNAFGPSRNDEAEKDIIIWPSPLQLGELHWTDGPSSSKKVRIANLGTGALTVDSVTLGGDNAADFILVSDTGETTLQGTTFRVIEIAFDPHATGPRLGTLTVTSDDPISPIESIDILGTGMNIAPMAGEANAAGAALSLDGYIDYVDCGSGDQLMTTSSLTIEAWIRANDWYTDLEKGDIVGTEQSSPNRGFGLRAGEGGKVAFSIANSSNTWIEVTSPIVMSVNTWHHVAGVYDGDSLTIFVDGRAYGVIDDEASPGIAPSTSSFRIGNFTESSGYGFDGQIDDVRIWNIARSESEIQEAMYLPLEGNEPGLVGYWKLDEGTGSTTADATGNGADGTFAGNATWTPISTAPLMNDELTVSTTEDTDTTVTLAGWDPDGDPLTAWVTELPEPGFGELYQFSGEGPVPGTLITSVPTLVTDPDMRLVFAPANQAITYTTTLRWKVNDALEDSTNPTTYTLTVLADNDPPDNISLLGNVINENEPSGTFIGTFSATDPDAGQTFSYSLVAGSGDDDNASYSIDGASLRTTEPFNFEEKNSYSIRVRATDDGSPPQWREEVFSITINDANDAPKAGHYLAGSSLDFDGASDYVDLGEPDALKLQTFTLECWFRREGAGQTVTTGAGGITALPLVTKGRGEADGSNVDMNYFLGIDQSGVLAADFESMGGGANHPLLGTTPIQNDQWYHAAAMYDGRYMQLYLDGDLEAELDTGGGVQPRYDSIQDNAIASALKSSGSPGGYFDGQIDEVRIWNGARSEPELQSTMNDELNGDEPGLVGYWKMNEGAGATTFDATLNGNDGSFVGSPQWVTPSEAMGGFSSDFADSTDEDTDITLTFDGWDEDGDSLTAWVTELPAAGYGELYQYAGPGSTRGALINSVPTELIDASMRVVYAPANRDATYIASLRWKVNDGTADSTNPTTYTINVAADYEVGPIHVDCNAPGVTQNGLSWETAYLTIQAAIDDNISTPTEIWVADGTYPEAIIMVSHKYVYGGFTGYNALKETTRNQRNWEIHKTIIDGSTARGGEMAYTVVLIDGTISTTLDGFTITGGFADGGLSLGPVENYGGGIYCDNADDTNSITNCIIQGNKARDRGAGIYAEDSALNIHGCSITGNQLTLYNTYGSGISSVRSQLNISHCTISGNTGAERGGGLYFENSAISISRCIIDNNSARTGGGIFSYDEGAITNSLFTNNSATSTNGGGVMLWDSQLTFTNCIFSGNSASNKGGGIYCDYQSDIVLDNVLFEGNNKIAVYEGNTNADPTTRNCLFYNNADGAFYNADGPYTYADSEVALLNSQVTHASDNITGDPLFFDAANGDYHILSGSAAIDMGRTVSLTEDMDQATRPVDIAGVGASLTYDIGAYELQSGRQIYQTPSFLAFGEQHVLRGTTASREVMIANIGTEAISISDISISGSSGFTFVSPPDTSDLGAGLSRTISIEFDPLTTGNHAATLTITSNAQNAPSIEIFLFGEGVNTPPIAGACMAGSALSFDGTTDYVDLGTSPTMIGTGAITISAWIKLDNTSSEKMIVQQYSSSLDGAYFFFVSGDQLVFYIQNHGDNLYAFSANTLNSGEWYHVCVVYHSDGSARFYINGVLDPSTPSDTPFSLTQQNVYIGYTPLGGIDFSGEIDEVQIWRAALTQEEIQNWMNRSLDESHPRWNSLVGYYSFNEGNGDTVYDSSGKGYSGSLGGDTTWIYPSGAMSAPLDDAYMKITEDDGPTTLILTGKDDDGDPITSYISELPARGGLYQWAGPGPITGAQIIAPDTQITDANHRVVFVPEDDRTTYTVTLRSKVHDGYEYSNNPTTYTITVVADFDCVLSGITLADIDGDTGDPEMTDELEVKVLLGSITGETPDAIQLSEDPGFGTYTEIPYTGQTEVTFILSAGEGLKTVYCRVSAPGGQTTPPVSDTITYNILSSVEDWKEID